MKTMMIPASLCFFLSGLGVARAEVAVGVSASLEVAPTAPLPAYVPTVPAELPPAPAYVGSPRVVAAPAATGGQWVFTSQYGWLYLPYGSRYVITASARPYAFAYYPSLGWRWLAAPWVVGHGPYPYFGVHGPFAYGWYRGLQRGSHPWAAHYGYPGHRPWAAPRAALASRPAHAGRTAAWHAPARARLGRR